MVIIVFVVAPQVWESQLTEALQQNGRLTDMLAEQAQWPVPEPETTSEGNEAVRKVHICVVNLTRACFLNVP